MKKFVKDMKAPSIFFEATPKDTIDIFAIYVPEAKNPYRSDRIRIRNPVWNGNLYCK